MFDPELFELTASQYRDFAMAMLTPTLAFLFLFLLALPLKKLPFLEAAEDYKPPGWVGARTLDDIRTFMIRMDGAQDFARIFVNNYLLIDNESPKDMLFISVPRSDDKREKVLPMAIDRSDYHVGSLSARYYLLKGKNYIIAEVENGYLGCNTVVDKGSLSIDRP